MIAGWELKGSPSTILVIDCPLVLLSMPRHFSLACSTESGIHCLSHHNCSFSSCMQQDGLQRPPAPNVTRGRLCNPSSTLHWLSRGCHAGGVGFPVAGICSLQLCLHHPCMIDKSPCDAIRAKEDCSIHAVWRLASKVQNTR